MNEVKNIPKLRFPEFVERWDEWLFCDFYDFQTTNSFTRDKLNYEEGDIYNLHYGDIHTKFRSQFNLKSELVPFINPDVDTTKLKENNYLKVGDLVIADASEDYDDIGKTIEIIDTNNQKVIGDYLFTGKESLRDDLIDMLQERPSLKDRSSTSERLKSVVMDFVDTCITGVFV